jgi:hypothetical protein
LHPTIYYTKKLIKELYQDRGIALFCDFHGHSRCQNAFVYGCRSLELPEATKIFPYILSKLNRNFSFEKSKYGLQKSKETTARITLFRELPHVPAIYTLETTFAGNSDGLLYTPEILKSIGKDLCRSLIPYCGLNVPFNLKQEKSKTVEEKH